jgi:hypothetical protein
MAPTGPFLGADGQALYGARDPGTTYPCFIRSIRPFWQKRVAHRLGADFLCVPAIWGCVAGYGKGGRSAIVIWGRHVE